MAFTLVKAGLTKLALEWAAKLQDLISQIGEFLFKENLSFSDYVNAGVFNVIMPLYASCETHLATGRWKELDRDLE